MEKNSPDNQRLYKKIKKFLKKSCKKIWRIKKVAISLHPLSKRKHHESKNKKTKLIEILKNKYKQSTKKRVALISLKSMRLK